MLNEKGEKMKEQSGIVRTNCIDCLDRTNVTQASFQTNIISLCYISLSLSLSAHPWVYTMQSMIGRKMLELQLRRIGVFGAEEVISSHPNFDERYKIC